MQSAKDKAKASTSTSSNVGEAENAQNQLDNFNNLKSEILDDLETFKSKIEQKVKANARSDENPDGVL